MAKNKPRAARGRVQFFISYTKSDLKWAQWIAWELNRAGYTYRMQAEHFVPGMYFINEMSTWLDNSDHVLALFSKKYFESAFASREIQSAVAQDPLGLSRRAIPIRIKNCTLPSLLSDLVYIDFVGKSADQQRSALAAGLRAALVGAETETWALNARPPWPGREPKAPAAKPRIPAAPRGARSPLRVQFIACDVGHGLNLKGQFAKIKASVEEGRFGQRFELQAEFDIVDTNLFMKLNSYRPDVVHISGNQNAGDLLVPSHRGGEVMIPDLALAGFLSSLGKNLRLVIMDTCQSYSCASRVADAIEFAIGVKGNILDREAIRFYEVFYQGLSAGRSLSAAMEQASLKLRAMRVPFERIPELCARPGSRADQTYLVGRA